MYKDNLSLLFYTSMYTSIIYILLVLKSFKTIFLENGEIMCFLQTFPEFLQYEKCVSS